MAGLHPSYCWALLRLQVEKNVRTSLQLPQDFGIAHATLVF